MRQAILEQFFEAYRGAQLANRQAFGHPSGPRCTRSNPPRVIPACITTLDLHWPCTKQEVQQAFRSQAKIAHPDVGGCSEAFRVLHQAYQEALALVE